VKRSWLLCLLAAFLLIFAVACGDDDDDETSSQTSAPATSADSGTSSSEAGGETAVTVKDFKFTPATITVSAGDSVTWSFDDDAPHTATADDNSFDSDTKNKGETYSETFDEAGTIAYHCKIHPNMKATIEVT
jgi:plastocyanin